MHFAEALLSLNTAIIIAVALLVGVSTAVQGRGSRWKSEFEAEKVAKDRLVSEKKDLLEENAALKLQNSKLASLPNLEKLYEQNKAILIEIRKIATAANVAAKKVSAVK